MQPEKEIKMTLDRISKANRKVAAFISETFPSVAGQIIPKKGVLQNIYGAVRTGGGICIADEVQTGLGRLGNFMFAFEQQEVIPDIVVLGKPLGNGYPIGAVVTNRKIADSFANGIEFFSTFGGSNLSCAVGLEVLKIVQEENLASNAKAIGCYLIDGLRQLQKTHSLIGDVRGIGLFIGVEIIKDSKTKEPGTAMAHYICNRMQEERILIGTEGPYSNVLKVRPPLTIERKDAENILLTLDTVLSETFCMLK
jgi:4-aminobutyrate aminotransferase-like enzyme